MCISCLSVYLCVYVCVCVNVKLGRYLMFALDPTYISLSLSLSLSLVGWDCRIHRLHLCRGVRPHHLNDCPEMTLSNLMVRLQYPGIAIATRTTLTRSSSTDRALSMFQIKLFDIETESKRMTYATPNY